MTSVAVAASSSRDVVDGPWAGLGFVPAPAVRVLGMRRSGNHAICNWLQRNAPQRSALFLNNCRAGADPLRSFNGLEVSGARRGEDLATAAAEAGQGAMLLVSYEDSAHSQFAGLRALSGPVPDAGFDHEVLIYRSPLNWVASLLRKMQDNPNLSVSDRTATLARALATYGDHLEAVEMAEARGHVAICYDTWVADELYRARVLKALGLPVRDNALGAVQPYGGGPTFQKDAIDAAELTPTDRHRAMATDPEYQAVLRLMALDPRLMAQAESLFPADAARLSRIAALPLFDAEVLQ